jgi:hypothetical protein
MQHDPRRFCGRCRQVDFGWTTSPASGTVKPMDSNKTQTFGVLAGAYMGKSPKLESTLTHACEVNSTGYPVKVLCKRVNVDHICPDGYEAAELAAPATCPACAKKDPRHLTREQKEVLIWRHTHKNSRSMFGGYKSILVLRTGGTTLVPLSALTEAELADQLKYAQHAEAKRLAAKAAK